MTERCETTDLLTDQCAHCRGHQSIEDQAATERAQLLVHDPRWFPAQYPGTCGQCGEPFQPGTPIRLQLSSQTNWIAECCADTATTTRQRTTGTVIHCPHPADTLKMLRETFCVAQTQVNLHVPDTDRRQQHSDRLERLIYDIDRQRPLGPDGKHDNRHTPTCGCSDDHDRSPGAVARDDGEPDR